MSNLSRGITSDFKSLHSFYKFIHFEFYLNVISRMGWVSLFDVYGMNTIATFSLKDNVFSKADISSIGIGKFRSNLLQYFRHGINLEYIFFAPVLG